VNGEDQEEIDYLREVIQIYEERLKEHRDLLMIAKNLLTDNKNILVLRKDDDFLTALDLLKEKLTELGV
jgi:hypothetical protein